MLVAAIVAVVTSAFFLQQPEPFAMSGDNKMLPYPLLGDAYRQLRTGTLPIWTPGRWGGSPLIGDPIVGALYPVYYLAYAMTDFPHTRAFDLAVGFHLVLLTAGTVLLLRVLGTRLSVALAATLILACNPTLVFMARSWVQLWSAMAYWPWLFASALRVSERPRVGWALLGALSLAGQVYAGYQQFALYSGTAALLWVVLRPGPARSGRIAFAGLIGAGAVGLAAPQVLPGLDMAAESVRLGPRGPEMMRVMEDLGLSPALWIDALRAAPFGLMPSKVAPVVIVFAALAVGSRRRGTLYFAAVGASTAFLATTPNPLYGALHRIPPFSFFGAPLKFFYLTLYVVSVLAALGLDRSLTMSPRKKRAVLCLVGASAAVAFAGQFPETWAYWTAATAILCLSPPRWLNPVLIALTLVSAGTFLAATQPSAAYDVARIGPFGVFLQGPASDAVIKASQSAGRFVALRGRTNLRVVGTNHGALWNVETLNGIGPLSQWRQSESMRDISVTHLVDVLRQWGAGSVAVFAGGRSARHLAGAGFRRGDPVGRLRIFSSPIRPPARYTLVPEARAVAAADAIRAARRGTALTASSVLIEAEALPGGEHGDRHGQVEVLDDTPPEIVLRVSVDRPTWLVARQPYYRNWRAMIDGDPATVHPAGGFFLGVLVGRGAHDVIFDYEEPGLFVGIMIAAATLLILPALLRRSTDGFDLKRRARSSLVSV
jgi:hypothetical protein